MARCLVILSPARVGLPKHSSNVRRRVVRRLVVRPPTEPLLLGKGGVCKPGIQGRPRYRRVASQDTNSHERTPGMAGPQPVRDRDVQTLLVQPFTATSSMQGHSIPPTAVAHKGSTHRRDGRHLRRLHDRPSMLSINSDIDVVYRIGRCFFIGSSASGQLRYVDRGSQSS